MIELWDSNIIFIQSLNAIQNQFRTLTNAFFFSVFYGENLNNIRISEILFYKNFLEEHSLFI